MCSSYRSVSIKEDTQTSEDQHFWFNMETLLFSTKNFHDSKKIGDGEFGIMYKVTWANKNATSLQYSTSFFHCTLERIFPLIFCFSNKE